MRGINVSRWLWASLAMGVFVWLFEGASSLLYMGPVREALLAHGMSFEMNATAWVISVVASLLTGLVAMFFYVAARPRFGPGPKTAIIVAVALWVGGYFLSLLGYQMIALYPGTILVQWGLTGLVELVLGTILGAWIYREGATQPAQV